MVNTKSRWLWSAVGQARNRANDAQGRIKEFAIGIYYWAYSDLAQIAGISPVKLPDKELTVERIDAEIQKIKRKINTRLKRIGEMGKDEVMKILLAMERILAIGRGEDPWQAVDTLETNLLAKGLL